MVVLLVEARASHKRDQILGNKNKTQAFFPRCFINNTNYAGEHF